MCQQITIIKHSLSLKWTCRYFNNYLNKKKGKIELWNIVCYCWGGARLKTFTLDLRPQLLTRVRPRRKKRLRKPHSRWTNREMFNSTSPRESSSSDLTNVSKVNFVLTWITFQEVPAMRIDSKCTKNE